MSTYYPRLKDYLNLDDLPEIFNFVKEDLNTFLNKLYLTQIQIGKSHNFSIVNYYAVLRTFKKIEFEIPGTGLNFVLNPDFDYTNNQFFSDFPISLAYKIDILKYVKTFKFSHFDGSAKSFFNLAQSIFSLTDIEILENAIETFCNGNILNIIDTINQHYSTSPPISMTPGGVFSADVETLNKIICTNTFFVNNRKTAKEIVGEIFIITLSPNSDSLNKIEQFFLNFLGVVA